MGKRHRQLEPEKDDSPLSKRAKLEITNLQDEISITTASDLKKLLRFHQDDIVRYRINLHGFRKYLEGGLKDNSAKNDVLLEYLTSSTNTTSEDQTEALPDIFQAWRYAVQVQDEGLLPSIPHTLAILLETISTNVKFSETGIAICETISRKENGHIFQKTLNSTRVKDATIGRCLDLLTQVVSFDGGACARNVWLERDTTLQRLPQLLGMYRKTIYGSPESTSIRDHAISYLLSNLRFQGPEAKADILSNRKALQTLLRDIISEKPDVTAEILSTFTEHVLEDVNLPRQAKGHLLNDSNLAFILTIVRHEDGNEHWQSLRDTAESFLSTGCTSRTHGIIYKQYGWYPPGTEELTLKDDVNFLKRTATTKDDDKYKDRVPVRNTTLAAFIQDLRPWASLVERRLILGIFEAAPESIADYFIRKKAFSFEPKLTATWVGWATFIHSVLKLPLPSHEKRLDGRIRSPPPTAIVLQNILPQALTSQALNIALKHKSELVKLFTLRILIAAFKRLQSILADFQADDSPLAWQAAAGNILADFQSRCPDYKQLLSLYQGCSTDRHILREALAGLIALYHTTTPQLVSDAKFDISSGITKMLNKVQLSGERSDPLDLLELEHLLQIGDSALEAKWWQKPEGTKISYVTIMLQLLATPGSRDNKALGDLLGRILLQDYAITTTNDLEPLMTGVATVAGITHERIILDFLDDCLLRVVRKPVKYHGDAADLVDDEQPNVPPFFMAISEQWPFFVKGQEPEPIEACARFLCECLQQYAKNGTSVQQLDELRERFYKATQDKQARKMLKKLKLATKSAFSVKNGSLTNGVNGAYYDKDGVGLQSKIAALQAALDAKLAIPIESEDHPALISWSKKDVSKAVHDQDVAHLVRYFASTYPEMRKQAPTAMRGLMAKIWSSNDKARLQLYTLLGTLIETVSQLDDTAILPSIAISFAARSVTVVTDPLHFMYTKINHFLSRKNSWDVAKLPSYWTDRIFNNPPTQMEAHWKEVDWFLETLIDGLRTTDDVNLYRRTGVFERVLANCTSVSTPRYCYEKAIDMLYRASMVGGASTLITKFGILAWIATQKFTNPKALVLLSALDEKVRADAAADTEHIKSWSDGRIRVTREDDKLEAYQLLDDYQMLDWEKPTKAVTKA